MRSFLSRAASCSLALFVLVFLPIPSESSAAFPRELRVQRPVPGSQGTAGVASAFAPDRTLVSQVLKKRAVRDCFGRPAEALLEKFAYAGPASRRPVTGAAQAPVTLRVLVLRIDFLSDRTGSLTSTEGGRFDLRRGTTVLIDPPPHNEAYFSAHMQALSRYYSAMSNSQIAIECGVFPVEPDSAFHLSDTADYGPWYYDERDYATATRLITDAVEAADNSSEPIVFSQYDMVYIFHAGADNQGDINGDSYYDIPSFTAGLETPIPVDGGASHVYAATVLPETVSQDGQTGAINGVIAHETGHMLGLPDMYNTDDFLPSVGFWSLMDTGNYLSAYVWDPSINDYRDVFGLVPGGLDAYCRRALGRAFDVQTIDEVAVGREWVDTLRAVESSFRVLNVPVNATEYFMIENRESDLDGNGQFIVTTDPASGVILGPEANEYDALLPGSGILIWHVDDNVISSRAAQGLSPNGSPPNRGVALEEADGIEDLGDVYSDYWLGSEFDPYFLGNATLFTPSSVPNSDANSGAFSHVEFETDSPRVVGMYVTVERSWAAAGWPVATRNIAGSVPGFGDFNLGGEGDQDVFLAGRDSTLRAWTLSGETYLAGQSEGFFARAPGGLMPPVCFVPSMSALVGVVAVDDQRKLYAWSVNDTYAPVLAGQVLPGWPPSIPSVTTSPCSAGNDVIAGCADGVVYALNASGAVRWTSAASSGLPVTGSMATGDADRDGDYEVAYSSGRDFVHCVSSGTGESAFPPFALPVEATAETVGPFLLMADVDGKPDSTLEVIVVLQSGLAFALDTSGDVLSGWPASLDDTVVTWPSAGDVDGDGLAELIVQSAGGKVYVVNGTGVVSSGWPFDSGSRADSLWHAAGVAPDNSVIIADVSGGPASELVFRRGQFELTAMTGGRESAPGWPLSAGERVSGAIGLTSFNGTPRLFMPVGDSLIWCFEIPTQPGLLTAEWPMMGGTSQRSNCLARPRSYVAAVGGGLISGGRVYAQPNPSRDGVTSIRFTLGSAASVLVELFDLSGRKVFSFRGAGSPSENSVVWPHAGAAPGIYMVRVQAEVGGRKDVAFCMASVIN